MFTQHNTHYDILGLASRVLGGRDRAIEWLEQPALVFGNQRPLDLLHSAEGREVFSLLLLRIEHGVYT
jgi:putative toxin-antitoxin system antitoxin component (TIGR02293 family)